MSTGTVLDQAQRHLAGLRGVVGGLDIDAIPLPEAVDAWDVFDGIVRLAGAAKCLLARAVDRSGVWQKAGERSAAEFLALRDGVSRTTARRTLATSRRLADLPRTAEALRRGELSMDQAELVADAAAADSSAEARLLGLAPRMSLAELRTEVGRIKAAADPDPEQTFRRIHARRRLRHWVDSEGAAHLQGLGTVTDMAVLRMALAPLVDDLYTQAKAQNLTVSREALEWDALIELATITLDQHNQHNPTAPAHDDRADTTGTGDSTDNDNPDEPTDDAGTDGGQCGDRDEGIGPDGGVESRDRQPGVTDEDRGDSTQSCGVGDSDGRPEAGNVDRGADPPATRGGARRTRPAAKAKRFNPKYLALLRIDLEALTRGQALGDEVVEIDGLGAIPVSRARALLGDAILQLVITRGRDVQTVTYLGRGPNAAQRLALLWSQPGCCVEGCPHTFTQVDHRVPWADHQVTELPNLDRLCPPHHRLKSLYGWALVEGVGKRAFVPPSDPRHPRHARHARHKHKPAA